MISRFNVNASGSASLVSVYKSDDEGERYFARLSFSLEGDATEKNDPGEHGPKHCRREQIRGDEPQAKQAKVEVDLPITQMEYESLKSQLEGRKSEDGYVYNDTTNRRAFLIVRGGFLIPSIE